MSKRTHLPIIVSQDAALMKRLGATGIPKNPTLGFLVISPTRLPMFWALISDEEHDLYERKIT